MSAATASTLTPAVPAAASGRVPSARPPLRLVAGPRGEALLLGEVLVPAGQRPVLRLVPAGAGPCPSRASAGAGRPRAASWCPSRERAGLQAHLGPARDGSAATAAPRRRRRARPLRGRAPGRALRLALVLLVVGGGLHLVAGGEPEAVVALSGPQSRVVVVEEGQTLWSLARELAPDADPRVVVERLRAANRLEGAGLAIGQRLLVPVGG